MRKIFIIIFTCISYFVIAQNANETLNNADIIKLRRQHESTGTIIDKIIKSPKKYFDVTAEDKVYLKAQGISDAVIIAMINANTHQLKTKNKDYGGDWFVGTWYSISNMDTITIRKQDDNYNLSQNGKTVTLNYQADALKKTGDDEVLKNVNDTSLGNAIFKHNSMHVFWQKREFVYVDYIDFLQTDGNSSLVVDENINPGEFFFTKGDTYNYGTLSQGPPAECDFEFTNNGPSPITISEAHGSCGCITVDWPRGAIMPGATGNIHVTYMTAGHPGPIMKEVTINSNANQPITMLHIRGNATTQ